MKIKKLTAAIGLGMGLVLAAGAAQAGIQKWAFQDDDVDFLWRPNAGGTGGSVINPSTCVGTDCNVTIGDVLISVFEYPTYTIDGANAIPAGMEVTGVSAIQFDHVGTDALGDPARIYVPYAGGLDAILGLGTDPDAAALPGGSGAAGGGAMIATYINPADLQLDVAVNLATNCTSLADCISMGSEGSLLQVDGFTGWNGTSGTDPDEFWVSGTSGTSISAVHGLSENTIVVNVNAALGTLFNTVNPVILQNAAGNPSVTCTGGADGCVNFRVTATVNGGNGLSNEAFAHSTSIASSKYVNVVPEPSTLALLGAGLLGMSRIKRRKS